MKLRKQTGLKAAVVATTAALMLGFFALVRAEPVADDGTAPPSSSDPDYNRVFSPSGSGTAVPVAPIAPHTRTRAS